MSWMYGFAVVFCVAFGIVVPVAASLSRSPRVDELPAFPCGFIEPHPVNTRGHWTVRLPWSDEAGIELEPDEARGYARRVVEVADEIEARRAAQKKRSE